MSIGDPGIEEALFDCAPGPAEQYEVKRRQRALLKSLRRLPDRQRRAVVLYYAREFTVTDTARSLKVSRMQAFRAAKTGLLALKKDLRLRGIVAEVKIPRYKSAFSVNIP